MILKINNFSDMDYHKSELQKACRVCGKRLNKAKGRERSHLVQEHSSELAQVFQIDTSGDTEDTHPTFFCHPCRVFMRSWHRNERRAPAVGRVYTWHKHSESDCMVSFNTYSHP